MRNIQLPSIGWCTAAELQQTISQRRLIPLPSLSLLFPYRYWASGLWSVSGWRPEKPGRQIHFGLFWGKKNTSRGIKHTEKLYSLKRTMQAMTMVTIACALSIATKIIDLGWPWTANTHYCSKDASFRAQHKKMWMNEGRPILSPAPMTMTLISRNIRYMYMPIFAVVPRGGGVKWQCGRVRLSTTAIFGNFHG